MPSDKFRNTSVGRAVRNAANSFISTFTASPSHHYGSDESGLGDLVNVDKRSAHNALERQRREHLNSKYQQLAHALPSLQKVRRPSKIVIVAKSLEFVSSSVERESALKSQLEDLRKKNERLRDQAHRAQLAIGQAPRLSSSVKDLSVHSSDQDSDGLSPPMSPASKTISPASSSGTLQKCSTTQRQKQKQFSVVGKSSSDSITLSSGSVDMLMYTPMTGMSVTSASSQPVPTLPIYNAPPGMLALSTPAEPNWMSSPPSPMTLDQYYYSPPEMMMPATGVSYPMTEMQPMMNPSAQYLSQPTYVPDPSASHLMQPSNMPVFGPTTQDYPLPHYAIPNEDKVFLNQTYHTSYAE